MNELTQDLVKQLFNYENGKLYWKEKSSKYSNNIIGSEFGNVKPKGYIQGTVLGKQYLLHHLVYLYHHGILPKMIDHINGDKTDNRIENLRTCNTSENSCNRGATKRNTTGHKGVFHVKDGRKKCWYGVVIHNLKRHSEYFFNKDNAVNFVIEKRNELHGDFTKHQ